MKKSTLRLALSGALCAATLAAQAMPANPTPFTATQPDGTQLKLSHRGDERCSFFVTEEGYIVRQGADGFYRMVDAEGNLSALTPAEFNTRSAYSADFTPSKVFEALQKQALSSRYAQAAATPFRSPARSMGGGKYDNADGHDLREVPTTGSPHVLVILVNFQDVKFSFCDDPGQEMRDMMTQPGYSGFRSTGSAFDYYSSQSLGQYTPHFDVYGPVQLSQPCSYYGTNDASGADQHAPDMVAEACTLLDKQVDFSQYDTNGDGYVDNVYVFYAGYGENDGGARSTVWPHSWELNRTMACPELDGVKINRYACSNELRGGYVGSKDPTGIGTFCHEFGHVLGQPDMYATDYSGAFTPGAFSAMDHGSYNNDGRTPPNFSAYERYAMEWIEPIELTQATSISMLPIADGGHAYKITVDPDNPTEYWLFENRQLSGWDTYIPGHGMIVWHIDYLREKWDNNTVNNTATHQCVDLVEADGTQSDGSQAGDTFPGSASVTEYSATSSPAFRTWKNKVTTLPITEISESKAGIISFNVAGGSTSDALALEIPAVHMTAASPESMSFSWPAVKGASSYVAQVTKNMIDPLFGDEMRDPVPGYEFANIGSVTTLQVDGLEAGCSYAVDIYAVSPKNMSKAGGGSFTTYAEDFADVRPCLQVTPDDVTASMTWGQVADATDYLLTVARRSETGREELETTSFDNKKSPADWMFTGTFDEREDYSGNSIPSLRLNVQDAMIISGEYDQDVAEISFWARVNRQNAKFKLEFYSITPEGAISKFATIDELNGTKAGETVVIDRIPEGVRQWMCVYTFTTASLILNIDDVVVKSRGELTDVAVTGYDALAVTGTSHTVTGLDRETDYVAYIKGRNAGGTTLPSLTQYFTTLKSSGISHLPAESQAPLFIVTGGVLRTDSAEPFALYATDGRLLASGLRGSYTLPAPGLYVVKAGDYSRIVRY